jgi:hypothetical protein
MKSESDSQHLFIWRRELFEGGQPKVIGSHVVSTPTGLVDSDVRMPHETGLQDQIPEKTLAD